MMSIPGICSIWRYSMGLNFNSISFIKSYDQIIPITKGWSFDEKYMIVKEDDSKYLLRIAAIDSYETKKLEFKYLSKLKDSGLNISLPLEMGICNEGRSTYTIYTWIEGEDANLLIPKLPPNEQYNLGLEAGKILKTIQSVPIDEVLEPWDKRYTKKILKKIDDYNKCGLKLPHGHIPIQYLHDNMNLLKDRPNSFLHGDFHIGNMVFDGEKIGIIDFNRFDFGDPYEDFNRMFFSADLSSHFSTGIINGYFNSDIPDDFFPLLALYTALNEISSLPWSKQFGQEEIDNSYRISSKILSWYNNYLNVTPAWYMEEL